MTPRLRSVPALLLETLGLAAVYYAAAKLGLSVAFVAEQVTPVWPPTGIALAAIVLRGRRVWPGIAMGAFLANLTSHAPPLAAAGIAAGNTLEALIGGALLARVDFRPTVERLRDVLGLIVLAAGLSTIVSATIGVTSLCVTGTQPWSVFTDLWTVWWIGDAMGDLVMAPLLMVWAERMRRGWRPRRLAEATLLGASVVAVSILVFASPAGPYPYPYPLHYLIFPVVIWAALRFGQPTAVGAVFIASTVAILATVAGRGPFAMANEHWSLVQLQLYMGFVSATALLLGAAIAERNRAERRRAADYARLQIGEERLRLAFEAGRMGAWDWNIETGEIVWSEAVDRMLAIDRARFGGTLEAFLGLVHPDDSERVRAAVDAAVEEDGRLELEWRTVLPDGSVRWLASVGEVTREDGRPVRMVGVSADITERKRLADELRDHTERLRDADRRKDEFLAVLAHELRNPLAPMRSAVELLARRPEPSVVVRARTLIERQLRHLVRLVDDLLDVARITSGKITLSKEALGLDAIVAIALELGRPLIDARGQRLTVSLPRERVWLDADATRLPQVIANLLNNAAKYTPEGGEIWLSAEQVDGELVLRVRDTGSGMTPEALRRAFELFAQADGRARPAMGGLGVGLSLARSLVALHGGTLVGHSDGPGRGSEFVLRLPSRRPPDAAQIAPAAAATRVPFRRVLVVDDNVDAADGLGLLLTAYGHDVRVAHDGPKALDAAREFDPDVVLLDLGMPGMDGYDVARRLRADARTAGVMLVAVSGYGQPDDRRKSAAAGFDHHFVKPVEYDALAALFEAPEARRGAG